MAVRIERERPDQRRHHRLNAPLFVEVGGHRVRAENWSLGGLSIEGFPGALPQVGEIVDLSMALPFQGFEVAFKASAEVISVQPGRRFFAVRYVDLGERERELMAHFIEELVRGCMGGATDTIQRIDVPVTPASLHPGEVTTPEPHSTTAQLAKLPVHRWPVRTVVAGSVYLLLGFLIFGYAGILAYANFFRMEVPTAVITAPIEMVEAQGDGRIRLADFKPGDAVESGDVLIEIEDSTLEREIELAEIAVRERAAKLIFLKQRYADELERTKSFAEIEIKNVKQSQLALESAEASRDAARDNYARLKHLYDKGFATRSRLDEAREKMITREKALASQQVELTTRRSLAEDGIGKRLYTGDDLIGKVGELEAEVRLAEQAIALDRKRYEANLRMRNRLAAKSPFDGTILRLPRYDHAAVRKGDVIAVIEQRRKRQVTAFLTQDEVARVGLGDKALLYVPALSKTLTGHVSLIDRTNGFIREQEQRTNPGYAWRGPADRSAEVTITFDDENAVQDHERYRSGLPVTVIFERRSQNSIISSIAHKLSVLM